MGIEQEGVAKRCHQSYPVMCALLDKGQQTPQAIGCANTFRATIPSQHKTFPHPGMLCDRKT
ncbi:MAG: hypothetical protein AAFZ35_17405 [Cyanobacteria bacterium J06649_12]